MPNTNLIVVERPEEVAERAANYVEALIADDPQAVLVLPTGRTPIDLYRELHRRFQAGRIDFAAVRTFNLDEWVGLGATDPASYASFMIEHLYSRVNLRAENCHIPDGMAEDLPAECRCYEEAIRSSGGADLAILGIGHNGHIGFNEPGTSFATRTHVAQVRPRTKDANAYSFDGRLVPDWAITMGIATIMESREILLLATGSDKAEILAQAITGPVTEDVPASILRRHPRVTVLADSAAGRLIKSLGDILRA